MRTCLANLILALWCSAPAGAAAPAGTPRNLASVVRAYRESPSPVRRKAIDTYAAGHPKEAALANFAHYQKWLSEHPMEYIKAIDRLDEK